MPSAAIAFPKFQDDVDDVLPALWRGGVSEFFATMIFVFIGTGAVVASQAELTDPTLGVPNLTLISLAHGFAIMVLVYAVGEVSGGHINPAVTWACLITNKISFIRALIYIVAQLGGAVVGSALLKSFVPVDLQYGMGCHGINPALKPAQGFGAEVIFTFIFIFVVFATAISPFAGKLAPLSGGEAEYGPGKLTPFAVGMTILILHTVGIPFTGASMNPARTFGPALVNSCWDNHWVYWIGPLTGSSIAAVVAQILFLSNPVAIAQVFKAQRTVANDPTPSQPATTASSTIRLDSTAGSGGVKEEDVQLEEH
eukprot:TRINITY_DN1731_c0_g1_i1.p1 TRINITY_DN1731_c0_g1~~TRINITY_DN1731_c0_g1_i1.p1  ORF type:complete len:312 (-),score=60.52 TRINITY_DN1731_c0_g1_i1:90-1025(-)